MNGNDVERWYQTARCRHAAAHWWAEGELSAEGLVRARQLAPAHNAADWRLFLQGLAAVLGGLLLAAGVICLVAANWEHLGRSARLVGMQLLLAVSVALAVSRRLPDWARTIATGIGVVLVGATLALVGQSYQTGADPWQLFATWALLALPWIVAGRSTSIWMFWLLVLNVAWARWADTQLGDELAVVTGMVLLNLMALAALELCWRKLAWLRRPAVRRLLAAAVLIMSGIHASWEMLDVSSASVQARLTWSGAALAIGGFYYCVRRDIAVLAMVMASVIGVAVTACAVWLVEEVVEGVAHFAVLALLVLVSSSAAVAWLRKLARETGDE